MIIELNIDKNIIPKHSGNGSSNVITQTIKIPGKNSFVKIPSITSQHVRRENRNLQQVIVIDTDGNGISNAKALLPFLDVYMLPKDKPATKKEAAVSDFNWTGNHSLVNNDIIEQSTRVVLTPLLSEKDNSSLISFKVSVPEKRFVYIKLKKDAPFQGGYFLSESISLIDKIDPFPKELDVLQEEQY